VLPSAYEKSSSERGIETADAVMRQRLEDLEDRLDEILNTLGWSAEAAARGAADVGACPPPTYRGAGCCFH
jgi:hypothetical protein